MEWRFCFESSGITSCQGLLTINVRFCIRNWYLVVIVVRFEL